MPDLNWVALTIFVLLFGFITWLGFAAARWRRGDLDQLHEWGLGGRRFGTVITWFLVGGDVYTAYTFIAVPALAFGAGEFAATHDEPAAEFLEDGRVRQRIGLVAFVIVNVDACNPVSLCHSLSPFSC